MTRPLRQRSWLVSAGFDLAWFIAPGYIALLLVLPVVMGLWHVESVSPLAWLLLVVFVDVAHVWTTLFRTYLVPAELKRRPGLYAGVPSAVFAIGFVVHNANPAWFWTILAYVAVHHFVKQQYGFVSLYRAQGDDRRPWVKYFDHVAVYTGTGVPILYWHTTLPREFNWFVEGDFVVSLPVAAMQVLWPVYMIVAAVWIGHRFLSIRRYGPQWGRDLTMLATWLTWYVGIVVTDLDFVFTVTNVLIHGVPYMALVWRCSEEPSDRRDSRVRPRWHVYLAICLLLALGEEWLWDIAVWHERSAWFGSLPLGWDSSALANFAVPLLMVPQGTHYILDGFIWKMDGSNPGLKQRIVGPSL